MKKLSKAALKRISKVIGNNYYPVGTVINCKDATLKVVACVDSFCLGCVAFGSCRPCLCDLPGSLCSNLRREDKTDIIFERIK